MLTLIPHAGAEEAKPRSSRGSARSLPHSDAKLRLTVVLDKQEHIPALMTITRFLQAPQEIRARRTSEPSTSAGSSESSQHSPDHFNPRVSIDALRLIELTERTSMLMKSAVTDELIRTDSLLTMYRTFGDLHDVNVSSSLSIVSQDRFAQAVVDHAGLHFSDMIVLSWIAPGAPGQGLSSPSSDVYKAIGGGEPSTPAADAETSGGVYNPFDALFRTNNINAPADIPITSTSNAQFVRRVFAESRVDVAVYVDRSYLRANGLLGAGSSGMKQHILLPFFGGPDDRLALTFVMQLCAHPGMTATIVRMTKTEASELYPETRRPAEAVTTDSNGNGAFLEGVARNQSLNMVSANDHSIVSSGL